MTRNKGRWVFFLVVVAFTALISSSKTTHSDHLTPMQPLPSQTQKALIEQRALVDTLKESATEIKKDADEVHREICP